MHAPLGDPRAPLTLQSRNRRRLKRNLLRILSRATRGVKTWIAIRLIDEDGNPVPDVAYSVTLPDGSIMTGSLDDQGCARFDDIDPGQCQVSFPEIHAKEWKPV